MQHFFSLGMILYCILCLFIMKIIENKKMKKYDHINT